MPRGIDNRFNCELEGERGAIAEAQSTSAAVALSRLIHDEFGSTPAAERGMSADENQV
ncbi:hypothetical protein ABIB56_001597 [Glaciihabitans sp. UYNi722]